MLILADKSGTEFRFFLLALNSQEKNSFSNFPHINFKYKNIKTRRKTLMYVVIQTNNERNTVLLGAPSSKEKAQKIMRDEFERWFWEKYQS